MIAAAEEIDPSKMTPGAWGLVMMLFLFVAGAVLFRSLRKQLNRVDFTEEPTPESTPDEQKLP